MNTIGDKEDFFDLISGIQSGGKEKITAPDGAFIICILYQDQFGRSQCVEVKLKKDYTHLSNYARICAVRESVKLLPPWIVSYYDTAKMKSELITITQEDVDNA